MKEKDLQVGILDHHLVNWWIQTRRKFYSDTELYASYEDVKEPSQVQVHIDYDMNSLESKTFEVKEGEFFYLSSYNPSNCPEGMEIIGYKVVGTNRVIKPYDRISFDKETNLKAIWKKLVKVTYDSNGAGYSQVANYLSAGSNVASDNPFGQSPKGKVLKDGLLVLLKVKLFNQVFMGIS